MPSIRDAHFDELTPRRHKRVTLSRAVEAHWLQKKSTICEARSTPLSASDASTANERDATNAYSFTSSSAMLPAKIAAHHVQSHHATFPQEVSTRTGWGVQHMHGRKWAAGS